VLSTHLYKVYINELLLDLERHDLGISIGNAYPSCPSCADDIVLLASNQIELQEMLHVVDGYSKDHQFKIHLTKSKTILNPSSKKDIMNRQHYKMTSDWEKIL
jgi:hypothetical protein